jgi:hypothetical protein
MQVSGQLHSTEYLFTGKSSVSTGECGFQRRSGDRGEDRNPLHLPWIELQFLDRPISYHYNDWAISAPQHRVVRRKWADPSCNPMKVKQCFGVTYRLRLQGQRLNRDIAINQVAESSTRRKALFLRNVGRILPNYAPFYPRRHAFTSFFPAIAVQRLQQQWDIIIHLLTWRSLATASWASVTGNKNDCAGEDRQQLTRPQTPC